MHINVSSARLRIRWITSQDLLRCLHTVTVGRLRLLQGLDVGLQTEQIWKLGFLFSYGRRNLDQAIVVLKEVPHVLCEPRIPLKHLQCRFNLDPSQLCVTVVKFCKQCAAL